MSSLPIVVARSSARAMSAPVRGIGGVDREPQACVRAGTPDPILDGGELAHELDHADRVELADASAVRRQRVRPRLGVVEERVDAFGAAAVDEGFEVPGDVGGGAVCSAEVGAVEEVMTPRYEV